MTIDFHLFNCFWLMVPLLVWNLVLGPRITDPRVTSDARSPQWLLLAENIVRILVFSLPLLMPLQVADTGSTAGLAVYLLGTLAYFASWLPLMLAPRSAWSNSPAGLLAPRLTPFFSFVGIALIGQALAYGIVSAAFIGLHTWHGVQNIDKS